VWVKGWRIGEACSGGHARAHTRWSLKPKIWEEQLRENSYCGSVIQSFQSKPGWISCFASEARQDLSTHESQEAKRERQTRTNLYWLLPTNPHLLKFLEPPKIVPPPMDQVFNSWLFHGSLYIQAITRIKSLLCKKRLEVDGTEVGVSDDGMSKNQEKELVSLCLDSVAVSEQVK
jgi:hypothetical protein